MNRRVDVLTQIVLLEWTDSGTPEQRSEAGTALGTLPDSPPEARDE